MAVENKVTYINNDGTWAINEHLDNMNKLGWRLIAVCDRRLYWEKEADDD